MKYRGNLDGSLILSTEFETKLIWCKLEYSPAMQKQTGKQFKISCYTTGAWDGFLRNEAKYKIVWWKDLGCGFTGMQVLHDPSLVKNLKQLEVI